MKIKLLSFTITISLLFSTKIFSQKDFFRNTDTTFVSLDTFSIPKGLLKNIQYIFDSVENKNFYIGTASFYSDHLEGTSTSTGETFAHQKLTCASNRFKLNTWIRITNLSNKKSIIVRVNDRMHPRMDAKGRIVDLPNIGAQKLDFIAKGLTNVKVEIVKKGTKK